MNLLRMRYAFSILGSMLCLLIASAALADNWPAWRGPRGDGTSLDADPPVKWSATENIAWKTPLPGLGHSSPIIWNDRIFLTTALNESHERVLLGLDRKTGRILWQQTVLSAPLEAKNNENSYASSTPATDGERVYVTFLDDKNVSPPLTISRANRFGWPARAGFIANGASATPQSFSKTK